MKTSKAVFHKIFSVDLVIIVLASIPVILWAVAPNPGPTGISIESVGVAIGRVLGLVGVSLFAINLIISARLKWIERLFRGLNRMYIQHSRYGQIALIALLFHPLMLGIYYSAGSFYGMASFLLPSSSLEKDLGIISLGAMLFLIVLTLFLRPKYNIWKWTHKFLGLAFFLGALHVWLIPSTTTVYLPLRIYVIGLCGLGLAAYIYRTVLGRFFVKRLPYSISKVTALNNLVTSIVMTPDAKPLSYLPGQFIVVSFADKKIGQEAHPFSLVSIPSQAFLEIAVKNLGDYTEKVAQLSIGSKVAIEGPFGTFLQNNVQSKSQVWIAGGIGITPFIGKARALAHVAGSRVKLFYCVKNDSEAVYLDELLSIAESSDGNFSVELFCSDARGYIDARYIIDAIGGGLTSDIYLCAPPAMIQIMKQQFVAAGISKQLIHSEEFNF